jgi:hypothetical protein
VVELVKLVKDKEGEVQVVNVQLCILIVKWQRGLFWNLPPTAVTFAKVL